MSGVETGRVVVVGSLHYDILVAAPDRPRKGETLIGESWRPKCGGKGGNQAVEAALAGASVAMVGAVGDDDFGRVLLAHLDRHGVDRAQVKVVAGAASGMSVAIEDAGGDYGAVVVSGVNRQVAWPEGIALGPEDILVLQNEIPEAVNIAAARAARAGGARVLVNAAPARAMPDALAGLVDVLVVNAVEAEMMGGGQVRSLEDAERAARRLGALAGRVVVTAGGAGAAGFGPEGGWRISAVPVRVVSTHGAGDCFVGVFAAAFARLGEPTEPARRANAAAGRLVGMDEAARATRAST